jgi:hypothetical protein
MSQSPDARHLFDAAEQAAAAGDFDAAYELLGSAARVQEADLGPLHPDLASTLNNLAIVAEKTGRTSDAETFYRRAAAIAAASFPPDHPMVRDSRQNLEDFCRSTGVPVDLPIAPPAAEASAPVAAGSIVTVAGAVTAETAARSVQPAAPPHATSPRATPPAGPPLPSAVPRPPSPASHPARASRPLAWIAIAAVVFIVAALAVMRPWSSRGPARATAVDVPAPVDTPAPTAAPEHAPASAAAAPPKPAPAPPAAPVATRPAPPAPRPPAVPVTLDTADLCSTFSTAGAWRCEPAGDSVAPGSIVLYTRVKSARDTAIVHRWYRGGALRQSVRLTIRANPAAGYRTYSRQTVDAGADWRVEVRSANGDLLLERRFAVR